MITTATMSYNPLRLAFTGQLNAEQNSGGEPSKEWRKTLTLSIESQLAQSSKQTKTHRRSAPVVRLNSIKGIIPSSVQKERKQALEIYAEIRDVFPGYGRLGGHNRRAGQNIIQVPGTGAPNFPTLSKDELKPLVWQRLSSWIDEVNEMLKLQRALEAAARAAAGEDAPAEAKPEQTEPEQTEQESSATAATEKLALGTTLYEQARGVEEMLARGKYEAARNRRFAFPKAQFAWIIELGKNQELLKQCLEAAGDNTELKEKLLELNREAIDDFNRLGKFCPAAQSLYDNLLITDALYVDLLPDLLKILEGMYPQMSEEMLIEAAAQAIDQELAIRHYVFWVWGDIFAQDRDRRFVKERASIDEFINGCFELFVGTECGKCGDTCRKLLATMMAGGLFKCHFEPDGPSTFPAQVLEAKGPSGNAAAHAINIPFDMEKIIAFVKVIFAHEFMHDMFSDINDLEEELEKVGDRALLTAFRKKEGEKGRLVLSTKTTMVGNQKIPTIRLLRSIFADTLNEMNADVSGGILLTGPAFLECMIVTFKALYGPILKRYGIENKFPNDTIYVADEAGNIEVEAHLPPYIRAKILRFPLQSLGFKKEARLYGELTDQATELKTPPATAIWRHNEGVYPNIELSCADLEAAGEIYAKAIMDTKLKALKGRSMRELMNWSRKRQKKQEILVKILCGELTFDDLPEGSIYVTYVAAATVFAYLRLLERPGMTGPMALELLQKVEPKLHDIAVERSRKEREQASCRQ